MVCCKATHTFVAPIAFAMPADSSPIGPHPIAIVTRTHKAVQSIPIIRTVSPSGLISSIA